MSNIIFITARCEYDIKFPAPEVPHLARPPYQPQQSTHQSYVATRLADFPAVLFYLCHVNENSSTDKLSRAINYHQIEWKDLRTSFDLWFFLSAGSWPWLSRQLSDFGRLWRWRAFGSTKVCESKWWRCRSFRIQHCRTLSIALNRTLQDSF